MLYKGRSVCVVVQSIHVFNQTERRPPMISDAVVTPLADTQLFITSLLLSGLASSDTKVYAP